MMIPVGFYLLSYVLEMTANEPCWIEVVKLVSSIMPLLALFQVFDGTSAVTGGVLRARGKQFVGALLNLRRVLLSYSRRVRWR
jgi:Na+-driven multidrug efflux pump